MNRVIIVQARMTSTRLPGKILMPLAGRPVLEREIERLVRCVSVDRIVIATTTNATDDPVAALAGKIGVDCYRGSENDVLSRFLGAARQVDADVVVRVTADCPLIDPNVVDRVVDELLSPDGCDYASNVMRRTYPRGLDTEAFFRDVLERMGRLARSPAAREHVTYFATTERPGLFVRRGVEDESDNSDLRWTLDTPDDWETIRTIVEESGAGDRFLSYPELLSWVRARPAVAASNRHVEQKKV